MEFDMVSMLTGALIGGAIIGAITLKYVRWASSEMRLLRWAACHLISINQRLGRALEAAGVPVERSTLANAAVNAEEWPESIEVNQ